MRIFTPLFISIFLLVATSKAATISGIVYSAATCSRTVAQVIIEDDYNVWRDTVWTNSKGEYSFTIPHAVYIPSGFTLSSRGCGFETTYSVGYDGNNIRRNLILCGTGTGVAVDVTLGNPLFPADTPFVVYLIRRDVDPVTFDTTLLAVDSSYSIYGLYGAAFIETPCISTGTYLLKAALLPGNPDYSSNLPTYYGNTLSWSDADTLAYSELSNQSTVVVNLVGGSNPGGPAFIGGSVLLGANKSTAIGDPLSSRILILTNAATGKAIGHTYSDSSGKFQFPGLPYGTYKIFGDAGGKKNPPLSVTLSANQNTVNNIVFEENNKKFEGRIGGVGIGLANSLPGVRVFPNPVTDFIGVQGLSAIKGDKTIVLTSMTGAEIDRQTVNSDASISTAALPPGIYLLQVQTDAGRASFRIVK